MNEISKTCNIFKDISVVRLVVAASAAAAAAKKCVRLIDAVLASGRCG